MHCSGDSNKGWLKTIHSSVKSRQRLLKCASIWCLFISLEAHNIFVKIDTLTVHESAQYSCSIETVPKFGELKDSEEFLMKLKFLRNYDLYGKL